jgi:type II secretory pathway predicted ATPase ExeA
VPPAQARPARRLRPADRRPIPHDRHDKRGTAGYLRHHLALAGRSDTLSSDDAIALIHQASRGYPRAVSNLAIQSLLAGEAIADESAARAAVTEGTTELSTPPTP